MSKHQHSLLYETYLSSPAWQAMRERKLAQAGRRCQHRHRFWLGRCQGPLQVHHRTYARLGHERLGDLLVLCEWHHSVADVQRAAASRRQRRARWAVRRRPRAG